MWCKGKLDPGRELGAALDLIDELQVGHDGDALAANDLAAKRSPAASLVNPGRAEKPERTAARDDVERASSIPKAKDMPST